MPEPPKGKKKRVFNEIKEDIHKHLNELKENTNKQLNEIRKTRQDMKEKFNKDIEILKKLNWNSGNKKLNKLN
jgi:coenzyme F420-reducing hydrogenase alpha subunit